MSAARPGTRVHSLERMPHEIRFVVDLAGESVPVWLRSSIAETPSADVAAALSLVAAMTVAGPLTIEAPVSAPLQRRLSEISAIVRAFSDAGWPPGKPLRYRPEIRCEAGPEPVARSERGVASFFSCGVDSFATLLRDDEITDLVYVAGLDAPLAPSYRTHHEALRARIGEIAAAAGKRTLTIETNARDLYEPRLVGFAYFGFVLGAVAQLLRTRMARVDIPASQNYRHQLPNSSHPVLDHLWGGQDFVVHHEGPELSRVAKVELLANDPLARSALRVCWSAPDSEYNCGRCEKCMRTMVALAAIGALESFETFPSQLDLERLAQTRAANRHELVYWRENLALARRVGASLELVEAIECVLDASLPLPPSAPRLRPAPPASRVVAPDPSGLEPTVAVVIPVYRQPQFVGAAIRSALESEAPFGIGTVVVNDGCPFRSSERAALEAREIAPERIGYVAQANEGLPAARNRGVRFALDQWPSVQALFFLDADNQLGGETLEVLWRLLAAEPEASWAYPHRTMFGAEGGGWGTPGRFNVFRQLFENQSDAASLVRRSVFESGEWFDESMRAGYEDWEFFLRLALNGHRALPAGGCGFRYRRRGFSMVESSHARHQFLLGEIRSRHPRAYRPRSLSRREHHELPRFALVPSDGDAVELLASVDLPALAIPSAEIAARAAAEEPAWPPITVVGSRLLFERLRAARSLSGTLFATQAALDAGAAVALRAPQGTVAVAFRSSELIRAIRDTGEPPTPDRTLDIPPEQLDGGVPVCDARGLGAPLVPLASAPSKAAASYAPANTEFAENLHIDRFETTFPWTGEPLSDSSLFVLAPRGGLARELGEWLRTLDHAAPDWRLHLVLAGEGAPAEAVGEIDWFETITAVEPRDRDGAVRSLRTILKSADILVLAGSPLGPEAVAGLPLATIVAEGAAWGEADQLGLPGSGGLADAIDLEARIDLFFTPPGGAVHVKNLDVVPEKIVELPGFREQPGEHVLLRESGASAGELIVEAIAGVPPRRQEAA